MRVIKLRKGYRLSLSDSEYEALCFAADFGCADCEGLDLAKEYGLSSRAEKLIYNRGVVPALTENRRDA